MSKSVTSTSRSMIVRLKDNDGEAWGRLVSLYTPLVYHWCQKLDLSRDDIPDVVQEVFQSVSAHIAKFRKDRPQDTFRGWLRTITRNKAIDHFRRRKKQDRAVGGSEALHRLAEVADIDSDEEGETETVDHESRSILFHQALEAIRGEFHEKTWRAFWRVAVDDCTPAEVAAELEMKPGAVRVAKCRVLQRLRKDFGDLLVD